MQLIELLNLNYMYLHVPSETTKLGTISKEDHAADEVDGVIQITERIAFGVGLVITRAPHKCHHHRQKNHQFEHNESWTILKAGRQSANPN